MAKINDPEAIFHGRIPPNNLEAECAVLGAMLLNADAYHDMVEMLRGDYFYAPAHRKIFEAMQRLSPTGKPVDLVIVMESLRSEGELESIGGVTYLSDLTEEVPSIKNVVHYGRIVEEKFHLRELVRASMEVTESIFAGSPVDEAYGEAENRLGKLSDNRLKSSAMDFSEMISDALLGFENRLHGDMEDSGWAVPWPSMRKFIHGFRGGEMVVIAARPSMGKTSFALNLMIDMATQQKASILMFSLEMTAMQITNNLLCIDADMDGNKWRKPTEAIGDKERKRIMDSVTRLSNAKMMIDDDPVLRPTILRAKARRMKRDHGLDAIVIDYLQLMNDDAGNLSKQDGRTQEMSNISRQLKAIAKEFNVPIFALAQLNRTVESRAEKVPRMSDLRESGSIEQDADVVVLLNRPEYYSTDKNNVTRPGEADVIIAKNRHGDVGTAEMMFIKNRMTFAEKDRLE
jgi:replicative DNA helicase